MRAHRRQILRKQLKNRRRGRKHSESTSDNGSWETGSASTCPEIHKCEILEHDQAHEGEIDESSEGVCDFIRDTRIDPPSLLADDDGADVRLPYCYHPDVARPGLAGNLSASQEAALGVLREWVVRESVDLAPLLGDGRVCPPEEEDLALLRFLRRNGWNVEKARAQLETNLSWRAEKDMAAALRSEPWEVFGCATEGKFEELCKSYYPHFTLGTDRLGRPVLVQKYGNFSTSKLCEHTTIDGMLRYHAWEQEKNAELLRRSTARLGYLVETWAPFSLLEFDSGGGVGSPSTYGLCFAAADTLIMDFKGMSIGLVNRDFLWLLKELFDMDRKYYPDRGGVIYIINTPPLFGIVWQGVRGLMEATRASIHIFSKEKEWKAALAAAIDPRILPVEYGGSGPRLDDTPFLPAVHRALDRVSTAMATVSEGLVGADTRRFKDSAGQTAVSGTLSSIVERFSRCSGGGDHIGTASNKGGGGSGGGSPLSMRSVNGSTGGMRCGGAIAGGGRPSGSNALRSWKDGVLQGTGGRAAVRNKIPDGDRGTRSRLDNVGAGGESGALGNVELRRGPSASDIDQKRRTEGQGGLGWALGFVPGARLAAAVVTTVTSATFGAAGLAASLVEAVVSDQVWTEAVQVFETSQSMGRWVLGA